VEGTPAKFEFHDNGVGLITLNRPEKLNAFTREMISFVVEVLRGTQTRPDIKCIVLTGAGTSFSSGHDINAPQSDDEDGIDDLFTSVLHCRVPVIVAARGWAVGGGAGLVLCSTIRLAGPSLKLMWPQIKGGYHGVTGPSLLAHEIPKNIALELMLTGRPLGADEAARWGVVNRVVAEDDLLGESLELAGTIASMSPEGVRALRNSVDAGVGKSYEERVDIARESLRGLFKGGVLPSPQRHTRSS
jgi:enoyl-CoA hydratase/carnithine racemase